MPAPLVGGLIWFFFDKPERGGLMWSLFGTDFGLGPDFGPKAMLWTASALGFAGAALFYLKFSGAKPAEKPLAA